MLLTHSTIGRCALSGHCNNIAERVRTQTIACTSPDWDLSVFPFQQGSQSFDEEQFTAVLHVRITDVFQVFLRQQYKLCSSVTDDILNLLNALDIP